MGLEGTSKTWYRVNMNKIFDLSLRDSYINALSPEDTQLLIEEAKENIEELESSIAVLFPHRAFPIDGDGNFIIKPSSYSYEESSCEISGEELTPALRRAMNSARMIQQEIGETRAILLTAGLHKARIIDKYPEFDVRFVSTPTT